MSNAISTLIISALFLLVGFVIGRIIYKKKPQIVKRDSSEYKNLFENSQKEVIALKQELDGANKCLIDSQNKINNLESKSELYNKQSDLRKKRISDLEDKLDICERKNNRLINENRNIEIDFKHTQDLLDQKEESLVFVKDILQAETASDGNRIELAVRKIVEFISSDLNNFLRELHEAEIDKNKLYSWALSAKKTWLNGKVSIAFVGAFSSGKTSIINRILSYDNPNSIQFPVDVVPTTAIPTYITSSKVLSKCQFYTPNNLLKNISEDTFKKIDKNVLRNITGLSSLIKYFVMKCTDLNFENLSILDTPGFFSNDKEDEFRTLETIGESDAIFWVIDINNGHINSGSLNTLVKLKREINKDLYLIINKVDSVSESGKNDIMDYIQHQCDQENIHIEKYIPFSKEMPIDIILDELLNINPNNRKDNFLNEISIKLNDVCLKREGVVKSKRSKWEQLSNDRTKCLKEYSDIQSETVSICNEVRAIPNYNTRVFAKDNYVMSQDEFKSLTTKLDLISGDKMESLKKKFNYSNELENELTVALNDMNNENYALFELKSLINKMNTLISDYQEAQN